MDQLTGGSAFPFESDRKRGMTLRDYFAGQALIAFGYRTNGQNITTGAEARAWMAAWAGLAYALADEMLKAREQL